MHFLCNVLIFESNFNCKEEIFININFFDEYVSKRKEFDLLIKEKNTKIENLIMLIIIIPFIEINSKLRYKINEQKFTSIFGNLFKYNINKKDIIMQLNSYDYFENKTKLINLLNYDWEIIPSKNIINILRYVINNFYVDSPISMFEKLLNMNLKQYIKLNLHKINEANKNDLIFKKNINEIIHYKEIISKKYYLISLI